MVSIDQRREYRLDDTEAEIDCYFHPLNLRILPCLNSLIIFHVQVSEFMAVCSAESYIPEYSCTGSSTTKK